MAAAIYLRDFTLSEENFARLSVIIEGTLGVRMPPSKRPMLQARLVRRAHELELHSVAEYCERLRKDPTGPELQHLLDLATTNHTFFFREPQQLARLTGELAARAKAATSANRPLSLWSAASSRGHELYTMAIMLSELPSPPALALVGTDVSKAVLREAARAIYPEKDLESFPSSLREKYFLRSRDRKEALVRVVPALRETATFQPLNLMSTAYDVPLGFDMVMLRNVLIYFDAATQEKVVRRVLRHLAPRGVFCISMSESLHGFDLPLEPLGLGIYRSAG